MLWKNGQVGREYVLGWSGSTLSAFLFLPAADSLDDHNGSEWVRKHGASVARVFGAAPRCEILADAAAPPAPGWESAKSLLLMTHFLDRASPIAHGERGSAVPLYTLPLSAAEREGLQSWCEEYRATDHLWIGSGGLEAAAYRQLADPRRSLLRKARDLARLVEERTRRPTYTFVLRFHGRSAGEARRPCPLCGGEWATGPGKGALPALAFPFQCERCRIVSGIPQDIGGSPLANVGEYRKPRGRGRKKPARRSR